MDDRVAVAQQAVLRVSVSNWSTSVDDVASTLAALHRAAGH